ncbi:ABC transporter ATP-binding protein [Psychrobacillus sp.]|uniref:ABC transporter ATP-binding protein n=1 Tax=Psychrobacillus sp. TaxID=1871623 RepID=UPI0028BE53ED|nr:ABC transporter ATP-binding protein [Psychrobacillus sp.]
MTDIRIDKVTKYFGDMKAVNNAEIHIQEGEFFTLLGPSGCGKTTLLRALAGFYRQDEGDIYFGEECISDLPAHKRNIGMVFQSYAIFPHMSVFDNVAYGLKARKVKKDEIQRRVMEALEMVELSHLKDRQPAQMSGGQQQRIALARAIVIHPGLLLMDEPLSNLDAKLRLKMRSDIRELQKRLNITTIYVTHDQEEALAVSDRIAVLNNGIIQQVGRPHEIYLQPQNKFVANFIGSTNFLEAELTSNSSIWIEGVEYPMNIDKKYTGKVIYSVRPEQIKIKRMEMNSEKTYIKGTVKEAVFLGEKVEYRVELTSGVSISINEHAVSYRDLINLGDVIELYLNPEEAIIYSEDGEEALNLHGKTSAQA